VSGRIDVANRIKSDRKPTDDISAYDLALRADWLTFNDLNPFEAVKLLEKAIEIDPEFALAHAKAAELAAWGVFVRGLDIDEARALTRKHGETATRLAPGDGLVNATLAEAYGIVGEHKLAAHHADVAMALNPNAFFVMAFVGWVKGCQGDYEGGIALLEKAMRNDPYSAIGVRENKVDVYYIARRYEDCVEQLVGWPNPPLHTELAVAAALAQLDRIHEAEAIVRKVTEEAPEYWDIVKVCHAYKNMCARPEDGEHWLEGFRKTGLPV
jgi:adenylate cyclase